jgi:hypothetical protein
MPDRTMYVGDSYPPMRFQLTSGQRLINLTSATSIAVTFKCPSATVTGPATPLWPAVIDTDGMHRWNLEYSFGPTDTSTVGTYNIFVSVTWPQGLQTFATKDRLIVIQE